jgi:hypothetical protein
MKVLKRFIGWLDERIFEFTTDPNSVDGLRHRANKLIDQGYNFNNPMVQALLKEAWIKQHEGS